MTRNEITDKLSDAKADLNALYDILQMQRENAAGLYALAAELETLGETDTADRVRSHLNRVLNSTGVTTEAVRELEHEVTVLENQQIESGFHTRLIAAGRLN